ncbi:lysozyme-like [Anticarsia gemmatalis]|uniref:lysozyme-like n=1 Tax=Anticarsia gemmatalis TaxID=129554 RepID=UPI003F764846
MYIKSSVVLFGVFAFWITGSSGSALENLNDACLQCLCYAQTGCDMNHGCTGGYCGPFNISRIYWVDAGSYYLLPSDDPLIHNPWEDCAKDYHCAKQIIRNYIEKFAKDCNGDGVIDCLDYLMINGNGGYGCQFPLERSSKGREWLQRFQECRP